jgi:transposase
VIWADQGYAREEFARWCQAEGDWRVEVVKRNPGDRGFVVLPKRWIVERTLAWIDFVASVRTMNARYKLVLCQSWIEGKAASA